MVAMSCNGIHCAGCGAGAAVPPAVLAAALGAAWVIEHLIEVAAVSAACAALAVYAVVALTRAQERREAEHAARGPLLITRPGAAPLPPARQRAELPPPVVSNYFYVADPVVAARVIRTAIPGTAGDVITGE
jgi:hypothetical protein